MTDTDVAIIGAGFAGLGAALRLAQAGRHSFVIFERAGDIGGTWRDNTYPGCACDIPSKLYSFSFKPNPAWSRSYSPQPEILAYLKQCVTEGNLQQHIRYNTEIIRTEFIETAGHWQLTDGDGNTLTARVVVGALGPLNRPARPAIPGMATFAGHSFHSSEWDHTYDLRGKRVAVIGTGASAIQIVPEVAQVAGQLLVYQRTAPYVNPRLDKPISPFWQRVYKRVPVLQQLQRTGQYWIRELGGLAFLGNETINKLGTKVALKHLETSIADPELRRKSTPDYKLGCKRVLISDDYYPALTRPNVELITDRITEITPTGIVSQDGTERAVDVLIYSTGFVAAEIFCDLHITGRSGRVLFDEWAVTGPESYLGMTTSGFPNLIFLVGPNTGLGHNSIVHMIESQVNYLLDYLRVLEQTGDEQAFLDVKPEVQQAYNVAIQQKLSGTVWASGCQSWYKDSRGKITTIWPDLTVAFRRQTRRVDRAVYTVVRPGNRPLSEPALPVGHTEPS